jgi:hypothetical protein
MALAPLADGLPYYRPISWSYSADAKLSGGSAASRADRQLPMDVRAVHQVPSMMLDE